MVPSNKFMQVGDIGRADDFNYEVQYTNMFETELTVRDGDVLTTTCIYDSMDRTEPTRGGLASQEEMCINFFMAYPAECCALLLSLHRAHQNKAHNSEYGLQSTRELVCSIVCTSCRISCPNIASCTLAEPTAFIASYTPTCL